MRRATKAMQVTEAFLVQRWGVLQPGQMEEDVKALFKKLKEVKVDKKCDAFIGMTDVVKKWMVRLHTCLATGAAHRWDPQDHFPIVSVIFDACPKVEFAISQSLGLLCSLFKK